MDQNSKMDTYQFSFNRKIKMAIATVINIPRKYIMMVLAGLLIIGLALLGFQYPSSSTKKSTVPFGQAVADSYDTLTIAVVGDLMCHSQQINDAKKDSGYDFNRVFAAVMPYLSNADLSFGNLETVTAGEADGPLGQRDAETEGSLTGIPPVRNGPGYGFPDLASVGL